MTITIVPDERGWFYCPDCDRRWPSARAAVMCADACGDESPEGY